jgi:hypothetical protein
VAGVLKLWLRELPEPLLTFALYDQFIAAQCKVYFFIMMTIVGCPDHNLRVRYIKNLLKQLPAQNRELLKYLTAFLRRVQDHSAQNKMAIHNLATVFGPNLLVPPDRSTFQMIQDTPQINGIVNSLIEDYEALFGVYIDSSS